jgi:ribonuclease E
LPDGSGRPHGEFDGDGHRNENGNGEHRRRRRGRRGGRRNRRDQDTQGFREGGNGPSHESEQHDQPDQPEASAPDITTTTYAPRIENDRAEPAATASAPAPSPAPAAAAEAPRRRSTVREPAPVFTEGAHQAVPAPVTRSEPVASSSSEADEANKPRRTGWWARRLLGGGKS